MEDKRLAEMISKIAHELRSPLTSIKGFSSTLVQRWDRFTDEQRFQFVETIQADAERMGRIVTEVLDLARIEAGKLELHPVRVSLAQVAKTAAFDVAGLHGAERIRVDVDDSIEALADKDRLAHILRALLENAVKFSDEGPIELTAEQRGPGVAIRIADRGVGIPEERHALLFSGPAEGAQRSGPSGTGLGLYVTKKLVEAHGGAISVESSPGAGATFIVTLPGEAL
jgi:signal transduction histidine kinase